MYVSIQTSPRKTKKYRAIFTRKKDGAVVHVDFGARGMNDYSTHHDDLRKHRFLVRFDKLIKKTEHNPQSAMTLSRWILWNEPSLEASFKDYLKRYGLKGSIELE